MGKKKSILLDTGVWFLFFSNPRPQELKNLLKRVNRNELHIYTIYHVIHELASHLARVYGREIVAAMINSSIEQLGIEILNLSMEDYIQSGILQAKHRKILSACDAMLIVMAKNNRLELHTSDKKAIDCLDKAFKKNLSYVLYGF